VVSVNDRARVDVSNIMRVRIRPRPLVFAYAFVIVAIVFSFAWQMLHGICPVP
jgi:hypothetical protein